MPSQKQKHSPAERRQFTRYNERRPLKFRTVRDQELSLGTTGNISRSGMLFTSTLVPKIASILWMDIDLTGVQIAQEIKDHALVFDQGFLGRVVRVEENSDKKTYSVGVCFITKDSAQQQEFKY